ncbi:MAG: peptidylprolyl isomerase [Flavobacteriaceae bacterium]|nr:peptidylprolyl isomerase [Flavobacteriaceae bacterium]
MNRYLIPCLIAVFALISCNEEYPELEDGLYAQIVTNKGTMIADLYYDKTPVTVANFVALAEGNHPMVADKFKEKKYYNGLTFHRVMDSFMIQGGDPTATGTGDPGFKFEDEFNSELKHDEPGILSMANSGPNSNGSQFFITEIPTPWLDNRHTVFGKLVDGMDVLDSISNVRVGLNDKPEQDIVINEINIIRKGSEAKNFDAPKVFSEELPLLKERQAQYQQEEAKRMAEEQNAKMQLNMEMAEKKKPTLDGYKEKGKTLPSGLIAYFIERGEGKQAQQGDKVLVNYEGYYTDGRLFDTSFEDVAEQHGILSSMKQNSNMYRPMPMEISPDAPMIPGFKEAVAMMKVGDKAFFYIPSHLAFGEAGRGEIPPNTDLIFLLQLVEVVE